MLHTESYFADNEAIRATISWSAAASRAWVCDWQERSYVKQLIKFWVSWPAEWSWLNTSLPLNPTWLPRRLPLTPVDSAPAHCDWKTSIKAAWGRSALQHTDKTGPGLRARRVETKKLRLTVGARPRRLRPISALLPFSSVISASATGAEG